MMEGNILQLLNLGFDKLTAGGCTGQIYTCISFMVLLSLLFHIIFCVIAVICALLAWLLV